MSIKKIQASTAIIILIFIAVFTVRAWSLWSLSTFGGDLGYDLAKIKSIIDGHITLIGSPIARAGGTFLYLGPFYYYLQIPFIMLTKLDPIGASIPIILTWPLTALLVYLINKKLFGSEAGIFSAIIAGLSPYFINRLGPPSQPYLIIPLTGLMTLLLLKVTDTKDSKLLNRFFLFTLIGLLSGLNAHLHYLALLTFPALLIYLFYSKLPKTKCAIALVLGFLAAISPLIVFDLRHEFFLSHQLLQQMTSGAFGVDADSPIVKIRDSLKYLSTDILGFHAPSLLTLSILLATLFVFAKNVKEKYKSVFVFIACILTLNFLGVILYSGNANPHYLAVTYPLVFILLGSLIYFSQIIHKFLPYILMVTLSILLFKENNFSRTTGYTMPNGLNLAGIRYTARIIAQDPGTNSKFNIASTLDGDTRSMPYRYLVDVYGKTPQDVEKYPESDAIYLVSRDEEEAIRRYTVWEIASFMPFEFANRWEIQNGIHLYKLVKSKTQR